MHKSLYHKYILGKDFKTFLAMLTLNSLFNLKIFYPLQHLKIFSLFEYLPPSNKRDSLQNSIHFLFLTMFSVSMVSIPYL